LNLFRRLEAVWNLGHYRVAGKFIVKNIQDKGGRVEEKGGEEMEGEGIEGRERNG
jgi:hypothetical protein